MFLILLPLPFTGIIPAHAGLTYRLMLPVAHNGNIETVVITAENTGKEVRVGKQSISIYEIGYAKKNARFPASPAPSREQMSMARETGIPSEITIREMLSSVKGADGNRDHPRRCGAHLADSRQLLGLAGSSPRVRGSPRRKRLLAAQRGIIPASAGLTTRAIYMVSKVRDHPRGCGAHLRK